MKRKILFQSKTTNLLKTVDEILERYILKYIKIMSKVLYSSNSEDVKHKNDKHRILHK